MLELLQGDWVLPAGIRDSAGAFEAILTGLTGIALERFISGRLRSSTITRGPAHPLIRTTSTAMMGPRLRQALFLIGRLAVDVPSERWAVPAGSRSPFSPAGPSQ